MSIIPSVPVNLDDIQWTNYGQEPSLELRNSCYFLLMEQTDNNINFTTTKDFIKNVSNVLVARPKLVLTLTKNDDQMTNLIKDDSVSFPWIVLTANYKVAITCPGCGTTHHGLWSKKVSD